MRARALSLGLLLSTLSSPAWAQQFGDTGTIIISAERLFGVALTGVTTSSDGSDVTSHNVDVGIFGTNAYHPINMPRLGLDWVLGAGFTLGGNASYAFSHGWRDGTDATGNLGVLLLGPRAGWTAMSESGNGVWLRAGLTLLRSSYSNTTVDINNVSHESTTTNLYTQADLEAYWVWSPADRFTVNTGLILDVPLGGSTEFDGGDSSLGTATSDLSLFGVGAMCGISAYF